MKFDALLALDIINDHFGPLVKRVCYALLYLGPATLKDLCNECKAARRSADVALSVNEVKSSLLAGIIHHIIKVEPVHRKLGQKVAKRSSKKNATPVPDPADEAIGPSTKVKNIILTYTVDVDAAIRRLRFPRFLLQIKADYGDAGVAVAEALQHNGVLTKQDMIAKAHEMIQNLLLEAEETGQVGPATPAKLCSRDDVATAMENMIIDRFIMRHPAIRVPSTLLAGDAGAVPAEDNLEDDFGTAFGESTASGLPGVALSGLVRRQNVKGLSRGTADDMATIPTGRHRQNGKSKRDLLEKEDGSSAEEMPKPLLRRDRTVSTASDAEGGVSNSPGQLWRFGWEECVRLTRHSALQRLAVERVSARAGVVMEALLFLSRSMERSHRAEASVPFSARDIFAKVQDIQSNRAPKEEPTASSSAAGAPATQGPLDWAGCLQFLTLLERDSVGLIQRVSDGADGGKFVVHLSNGIQELKLRTAERIIHRKFGAKAARLVRLLYAKHQLEEKQVADVALLPPKEARALLYRLFEARLLQFQEIPRRPDHAPTHTFYTWSVDLDRLFAEMGDQTAKAVLNLRKRNQSERAKNADLVSRAKRTIVTTEEADVLRRLGAAVDKLDAALMHVDQTFMLFTDW